MCTESHKVSGIVASRADAPEFVLVVFAGVFCKCLRLRACIVGKILCVVLVVFFTLTDRASTIP